MSVSIYVDGWDKHTTITKVYCDELHGESYQFLLDQGYFEDDIRYKTVKVEEDTGRLYETREESEYPELNMANDNFIHILKVIGYSHLDYSGDMLAADELEPIHKQLVKVLNSEKSIQSGAYDSYVVENVRYMGLSTSYITDRLQKFLEIVTFAKQRGVGIYWG